MYFFKYADSHIRQSRKWRRRSQPYTNSRVRGFVLSIILLTLFTLGLTSSARRIENETHAAVEQTLRSKQLGEMNVETSGRHVTIVGSIPAGVNEETIRQVAANAKCRTHFGSRVCPISVETSVLTTNNQRKMHREWLRLVVEKEARSLTLRGEVPDETTKQALIDLAISRAGETIKVMDKLSTYATATPEAWWELSHRAVVLQTHCESGQSHIDGNMFSFVCFTQEDRVSELAADASRPVDGVTIGNISVTPITNTDNCEKEIDSILATAPFQFESKSATLKGSSKPTLSNLAAHMSSCPGRFEVQGHTDSRGSRDENMKLSFRRARSIVEVLIEEGVDPSRLQARGLGADYPIGNNAMPEGRAKNRRIEIRVVDPITL